MSAVDEATAEQAALLEWFGELGYAIAHALAPDADDPGTEAKLNFHRLHARPNDPTQATANFLGVMLSESEGEVEAQPWGAPASPLEQHSIQQAQARGSFLPKLLSGEIYPRDRT